LNKTPLKAEESDVKKDVGCRIIKQQQPWISVVATAQSPDRAVNQ
jgi:hypothetical protein